MLTRTLLPAALLTACCAATAVLAASPVAVAVVQKGRAFATRAISVHPGDMVRFLNEDVFIHQIYVQSAAFSFDSDEQAPGREVDLRFPKTGTFEVRCQIHPKMLLQIDVQ